MNKKGLEFEPVPIIMAVAGVALAWVMASRMGSGILMKIVTVLITGVACYFLSYMISNK